MDRVIRIIIALVNEYLNPSVLIDSKWVKTDLSPKVGSDVDVLQKMANVSKQYEQVVSNSLQANSTLRLLWHALDGAAFLDSELFFKDRLTDFYRIKFSIHEIGSASVDAQIETLQYFIELAYSQIEGYSFDDLYEELDKQRSQFKSYQDKLLRAVATAEREIEAHVQLANAPAQDLVEECEAEVTRWAVEELALITTMDAGFVIQNEIKLKEASLPLYNLLAWLSTYIKSTVPGSIGVVGIQGKPTELAIVLRLNENLSPLLRLASRRDLMASFVRIIICLQKVLEGASFKHSGVDEYPREDSSLFLVLNNPNLEKIGAYLTIPTLSDQVFNLETIIAYPPCVSLNSTDLFSRLQRDFKAALGIRLDAPKDTIQFDYKESALVLTDEALSQTPKGRGFSLPFFGKKARGFEKVITQEEWLLSLMQVLTKLSEDSDDRRFPEGFGALKSLLRLPPERLATYCSDLLEITCSKESAPILAEAPDRPELTDSEAVLALPVTPPLEEAPPLNEAYGLLLLEAACESLRPGV